MEEASSSETQEKTDVPQRRVIAVPRLGRVQMVLYMEGPSIKARIGRMCSKEEVEADPEAPKNWEMQDLAALAKLCEKACDFAMEAQTALPMSAPPQSVEREPEEAASE